MQKLLCHLALIFGFSSLSYAQNFAIETDFYDSLAVDSYQLFLKGHAEFNDSMQVYYSVKTRDSIPQLLFMDSIDFTSDTIVYPSGFSYVGDSSYVSVNLGNYSTPYLILELIARIEGEIREHIYVDVYYFTLPEEE